MLLACQQVLVLSRPLPLPSPLAQPEADPNPSNPNNFLQGQNLLNAVANGIGDSIKEAIYLGAAVCLFDKAARS
jgi:hypothetical protein